MDVFARSAFLYDILGGTTVSDLEVNDVLVALLSSKLDSVPHRQS